MFGVVEMEGLTPPRYRRHQYTDELVGRAMTWNYSPGLTSIHLLDAALALLDHFPGERRRRCRCRMRTRTVATRRSFIQTAGAALSVPLAAAAASVPASAVDDADPTQARLEDAEAIRALNREYARRVNAGDPDARAMLFTDTSGARFDADVRGVVPDGFGERDVIDIAPDRQSATGAVYCTALVERAIGPDSPLVEMARQQGGGVLRRFERIVFENVCARRDGVRTIQRSACRDVVRPLDAGGVMAAPASAR